MEARSAGAPAGTRAPFDNLFALMEYLGSGPGVSLYRSPYGQALCSPVRVAALNCIFAGLPHATIVSRLIRRVAAVHRRLQLPSACLLPASAGACWGERALAALGYRLDMRLGCLQAPLVSQLRPRPPPPAGVSVVRVSNTSRLAAWVAVWAACRRGDDLPGGLAAVLAPLALGHKQPLRLYVVRAHRMPVAIAATFLCSRGMAIHQLQTVPAARRSGYARALCLHLLEVAAREGTRVVGAVGDIGSLPVWGPLGFRVVDELLFYRRDRVAAIQDATTEACHDAAPSTPLVRSP